MMMRLNIYSRETCGPKMDNANDFGYFSWSWSLVVLHV